MIGLDAGPRRGPVASLLDAIPDPAVLVSPNHRVLEVNEGFRRIFCGERDVKGRHCYEVCHGRSRPCELAGDACPLEECLETGRAVRAMHVHGSLEGELHTEMSVRPVTDGSGAPIALLEIQRPFRVASARPSPYRLVGRSAIFNRALLELARLGTTPHPVLVSGESGTGKELFARALHDVSSRSSGPFVPVDAAALQDWRFERDFFGHDEGHQPAGFESSEGLVGAARGGSLFLRRVEDLPEVAQIGLLRLLETGRWRPEGSSREHRADVRLICSTSADLEERASQGRFHRELLLRLGSFVLEVPPLRDRLDDLPLLIECYLAQVRHPPAGRRVSEPLLEVLRAYPFPGNLRELATVIERAAIEAQGQVLRVEHLPESIRWPAEPELSFRGPVVSLRE
ncbi:MAG TPA: sigma 54-interacting transcriptional regulator, partial [Thermoanaerobaculia bacterium]|nr:sigma 54-interacting transcriptional regulator [Thermoanaerobaculia bacterium]